MPVMKNCSDRTAYMLRRAVAAECSCMLARGPLVRPVGQLQLHMEPSFQIAHCLQPGTALPL